jgi:hypothetical protein
MVKMIYLFNWKGNKLKEEVANGLLVLMSVCTYTHKLN